MKKHLYVVYKIWSILSPFHKYFYLQLFIILVSQFFIVGIAFLNGYLLTSIVAAKWSMVVLFFGLFLLAHLLDTCVYFFDQRNRIKHLDQSIFQFLQEFSMKKILSLTSSQHIDEHSALKLTIISKGEWAVQGIIDKIITQITPTITLLLVTTVTLGLIHPLLGAMSVVVFLVVFVWTYYFQKHHYQYVTKNRDNWNSQNKERTEAFEHLNLVKLLARENFFVRKFMSKRQKAVDHHIFTVMRSAKNNFERNFFIEFSVVSTLGLAVYLYTLGAYAIGIIYTVFNLVNRIYWNISSLSSVMRELPQLYADVEKYLHAIEKEPSFIEGGKEKTALSEDITFENVTFAYTSHHENETYAVFENLSLTIKANKATAIVGESGSGKSTITKLLLRAYDYQNGSIKIGNTELRDFDVTYLRESIGYVEQHVDLLDDTVKENILFGVKEHERKAKESELEEIAKKARIDMFYHRLGEKKFDILVGERGIKLSGGERQRIGIARAIIKNPDILIFDEATSSLDTENEKHVMDAIKDVSKGKTTIIIAHRLSTTRDADKIIVMSKGQIVGEGTHDELIESNEVYQNLVAHQV